MGTVSYSWNFPERFTRRDFRFRIPGIDSAVRDGACLGNTTLGRHPCSRLTDSWVWHRVVDSAAKILTQCDP